MSMSTIECPCCGHEFSISMTISDGDILDCQNPECKAQITIDMSYEEFDDEEAEEKLP